MTKCKYHVSFICPKCGNIGCINNSIEIYAHGQCQYLGFIRVLVSGSSPDYIECLSCKSKIDDNDLQQA
jgi:DNA-directed RNA polymerase subunit RPC12/RpoP